MIRKKLARVCSLILAVIMLSAVFAGCSDLRTESGDGPVFASFRDIPGVTAAEIAAVEELQGSRASFNYAMLYVTNSFYDEDGVVGGFAALVCEWLAELFGIPFIPSIVEWDELIAGLEDGCLC